MCVDIESPQNCVGHNISATYTNATGITKLTRLQITINIFLKTHNISLKSNTVQQCTGTSHTTIPNTGRHCHKLFHPYVHYQGMHFPYPGVAR